MRKWVWFMGLGAVLLIWAGCVPLDHDIPVYAPGQVEDRGRSPLDTCEPHALPHRLIRATASMPSSILTNGSAQVNDQAGLDYWWSQVNAQLDPQMPLTSNGEPLIDWGRQTVLFAAMPANTNCQRATPYGDEISSDCYTITVLNYIETDGPPCDPHALTQIPVFIYIFPITNLPVAFKWITPTPQPTATFTATATVTATPTVTPTPTPSPLRKYKKRKHRAQLPV